MNILITGGGGQLSNALSLSCPKNINIHSFSKKNLDITNQSMLYKIIKKIKPHAIINTAAYTKVDLAETNFEEANKVNSIGPKYLSLISKEFNCFLIHISTDYVFDGKKGSLYTETDITNPISVYGKTKLMGEREIIKELDKYIIFRVSGLYGPEGNNFVFKILKFLKELNSIKVVNDQYSRPTSTLDFSKVIWNVIKNNRNKKYKTGIYNYSDGGDVVSRYEIAKYIANNIKDINFSLKKIEPISSLKMNFPAKRPNNSGLSLKKTIKDFNIKETNWKDSVLRVIKT
tara:strand:+ start:269 stop:1132 length:864 start_codon:yes stop_codon:yes gene_type:complete